MLKCFSVDRFKAQSLLITSVINILVVRRFRVVYREIFHEPLAFSRHTINATYAQHKMGRLGNRRISLNKQQLSCVLISCFFLLHDIKGNTPSHQDEIKHASRGKLGKSAFPNSWFVLILYRLIGRKMVVSLL